MALGVATPRLQFDLRDVSAKMYPFTSRKRWVFVATAIFLAALGAIVIAANVTAITNRSLSFFGTFDLLVILVIVVGGIGVSVPTILKLGRGADCLRIDDLGFELVYPDGKGVGMAWGDPALDFELIDLSDANPSKVLTGIPYSIGIHGVRSLLTKDAYTEMFSQVNRRGLIDSQDRGSRWVYSSDANPLIHHIRAATGRR